MQLRHTARIALPLVLAMMAISPALGLMINGRNLQAIDAFDAVAVGEAASWLLRLSTLTAVAMLALVVFGSHVRQLWAPAHKTQISVFVGCLLYVATNVIAPGLFGHTTGIGRTYFYVLLLFVAIYAARDDGFERLVVGAKWSLLILLVASFLYAVVRPDAALRSYAAELRLPFVPFRFWGLGSGPNSIGPLALVLVLLAIARPFSTRLLQGLALVSGGAVVVLAQSQTTWIAMGLIMPGLLYFRYRLRLDATFAPRVPPAALAIVGGLVAGGLLLIVVLSLGHDGPRVAPTGGLPGQGDLMTGRGLIWHVAVETFGHHPLFGYGLDAWGIEFRNQIAMPYASHAHNQLLQSLSIGGVVGGAGLLGYLLVLCRASMRAASATGGLAPALMVLAIARCLTETPFDLATLLLGDTLTHALLFGILIASTGDAARSSPSARGLPRRAPELVRSRQGG